MQSTNRKHGYVYTGDCVLKPGNYFGYLKVTIIHQAPVHLLPTRKEMKIFSVDMILIIPDLLNLRNKNVPKSSKMKLLIWIEIITFDNSTRNIRGYYN